ncbi:RidA family protein [Castellaniella sp. GW247-6E4]|uniref:RidA family protein n=1 Tax=Castellaniella sp. GW247-6E4 TaxID=3140380 RepID=UPI003315E880
MGNKDRQEIRLSNLGDPISHYTDAVRFGETVYVSGIAALDSNGKVVGGDDVVEQCRQVFRNMKTLLDAVGAKPSNILRVTVYLLDVNDRTKINPVRKEFFGDTRPASTLIGVKNLAMPDMKIEIEAIVGLS